MKIITRPATVALAFLSALLTTLVAWPALNAFPINGGDALWVSQSARALVGCARNGEWSGCPGTYQFGLIQHAPAFFLAWRGLGDEAIVFVLTLLNLIAFVWVVVRGVKFFLKRDLTPWPFLLLVLVGPLFVYSVYSFSEMLVTVTLLALVMFMLDKRAHIPVALLSFLAASSREAGITLVLPIVFVLVVILGGSKREMLRRGIAPAVGAILGLASVLLFNLWKFGTMSNPHYADPIRRVPGIGLKAKNFLAVWISPSGGVLPVWVVAAVVSIGLPVLFLVRHRSRRSTGAITLLLMLVLVTQTALLSSWYAPFGWVAWGPRLIMPTVAVVAFLNLVLFAPEIQSMVEFLKIRVLSTVVMVMIVAYTSMSNLGFLLDRNSVLNWFTPPGPLLLPGCVAPANIEVDRQNYFDCALDFTPWQLGRTLWDVGIHQVGRGWGALWILHVGVMFAGLFSWRSQHALGITVDDRSHLDD